MKLRNKKTGEIVELTMLHNEEKDDEQLALQTPTTFIPIDSLAELNEGWEDYEEPTSVYYIDFQGDIHCADIDNDWSLEKKLATTIKAKKKPSKR